MAGRDPGRPKGTNRTESLNETTRDKPDGVMVSTWTA